MDTYTDAWRTFPCTWLSAAARRALTGLLLPIVMVLFARTATAQSGWTVTDLGILPGFDNSYAQAINNAGQVVGSSGGRGTEHAFIWTPSGGMTDLGTLPGFVSSGASGINNTGQVVGYSSPVSGINHAFLWTAAGGMIDLGTLGGASYANDINNAGQVVGSSGIAGGIPHAFLWTQSGGMTDLGTLGGGTSISFATGINDAGQVVGYSSTVSDTHAFLWTAASGMVDLGVLGGSYSAAYGINDAGQVIGYSTTVGGDYHAFLWTAAGGMIDLGTLGGASSQAYDINNAGQVVGSSALTLGTHAFLWTAANGQLDLGTLGTSYYSFANGINDAGQIVGFSYISAAGMAPPHAVLWNPPAPLSVTALTSDATFPVTAGTPVTWTATANGGTAPYTYQFWVFNGITWTLGRDWGTANSWTWEPPLPGSYDVQVWVRNAGSGNAYDAWLGAAATITMPSVLTVTTVTPSAAAVPAGTPVTWTATTVAGVAPYTYQFWVYDGAQWTVAQAWSASPTWTWTPLAAGTYAFQVWVRNAGSGADYDAWHAFGPYTATRPAALTITALAADWALSQFFPPNTPSPPPARTPVTWTATSAGGSGPYTHAFYVFDGSTWTLGQDWSPSNTWTWIPPAEGSYWVQAWARNAGSITGYDAWRSAGPYAVSPARAHVEATFSADRVFPVPARTPVQLTARGFGGTGPYTYKFYVYDGSTYTLGRDWSPESAWTWIPPMAGTYSLQPWVRNAGSVADFDFYSVLGGFTVSAEAPISTPSVTMTPMAPLVAGGPAVVTATTSGGTGPYTYLFYVFNGTTWTVGQDWSASSIYVWTPPAAGTYWFQIWVRNAGSGSFWDAWADFGPLAVLP